MGRRAGPSYRLFFAVKPPPPVARQIDHYAAILAGGEARIASAHQHVTLSIANDMEAYPQALIDTLRMAAADVMADPFDLRLDRLSYGGRSAALRPSRSNASLARLQRQVADAMKRAGALPRKDWTFSPHQTLFYRDGPPAQRRIDGFGWRVEDVVLICSHVGRTRHDIVGTWPLQGSAQYSLF
ncbi:2'-5' RNA ligase family protein [Sphingobium sp. CR2-8]|uniref:2'-5' RNA ligase family protein n=1 Tax=Sphingobium sp. CR2-8 TaxID=1306534 RepID=UPI002DBAC5B7|nr:2'-5' RNA ligase family protein [Sphingobium sp. CR2-8]MEC3909979.1 2'-5' RNA ligase family protein [Sphingobium sp. CR2-8]